MPERKRQQRSKCQNSTARDQTGQDWMLLVNLCSKSSQFSHKETTEFSWKSILSHETPLFGALGMWCIKCSGESTWFHPNSSNNPSKSCQAETDFDLILLMSADGSLARLGGWATHACLWVLCWLHTWGKIGDNPSQCSTGTFFGHGADRS